MNDAVPGRASGVLTRVLVVEDDAAAAAIVADLLALEGLTVTVCMSAAEALRQVAQSRFALAVVDLNLPDCSGTEFLAQLVAEDRRMRTIVHTGHSTHEAAVQALNLGAYRYVQKGGDPAELIQACHQAVSQFANDALHDAQDKLQRIADNAPGLITYICNQGRYRFVNQRYCEWNQRNAHETLDRSVAEVLDADRFAGIEPALARAQGGQTARFTQWHTYPDGEHRYIANTFVPDSDDCGTIRGVFVFGSDETEQENSRHALAQSEATFRAVYESSGMGIALLEPNDHVTDCNRTLQRMLGYTASEVDGLHISQLLAAEDVAIERPYREAMAAGSVNHYAVEQRLRRKDGSQAWANVIVSAVRGEDSQLLFRIVMVEDITEKKRMSEELTYQAKHDPLTGLINRREFEDRLRRVLTQAETDEGEHALCYLDLDQFKIINDTCGHIAGDELLRQLGGMLPGKVRRRDTLARLGGDEFGVLMEHCPLTRAMRVAEEIRDSLEEYRFYWDDKSFRVGASIGLVPITSATQTVADVLSAADAACYTAKETGRNRVHIYRPDDDELLRRHSEMQWFGRIGRALDEDRFVLYGQDIAPTAPSADDKRHFEVLVRMLDEDGSIIPPGAFLPAAERYNLMVRIDKWVIEHTLRWLSESRSRLDGIDVCAVNLSAQSLSDPTVLEAILAHLRHFDIPGDRLCLEITETTVISNLPQARRLMHVLRREGIRFALDDFGSGFASFAYLKNLDVDFLKIDGVFVKDIAEDPLDRAMVSSINQIGQVMGKTTIAEFVENEQILEHLREIGVDYAQGYGIGRPQPLR